MNWFQISFSFALCDLMSQSQLILFIWWPSCLVADSASDTLTAVCPNTPRSLLLAGLAGEYYWMSIWPHYKCVATGNPLGEERGEGGQLHHGIETWPLSLFFFPSFFFFSSSLGGHARAHMHMCTRARMHSLPKQRYVGEEENQNVERLSDTAHNICLWLNVKKETDWVRLCVCISSWVLFQVKLICHWNYKIDQNERQTFMVQGWK